jgi:hypothetical protein
MYSINPTAGSTSMIEADTPDDLNSSLDDNGSGPFGMGTVSFTNFAPPQKELPSQDAMT